MARKVSQETKDRIIFMYQWERDITIEEIANINNVSVPEVHCIVSPLKKNGTLKGRSRPPITDELAEQIMHEYYVLDKTKRFLCKQYKLAPREFIKLTHKWQDKYPPKKKGRRHKEQPKK